MFNKNNDICLKIVNLLLTIISVLSLGFAIGNNYFDENGIGTCNRLNITTITDIEKQAKVDYENNCYLSNKFTSEESQKNMYIGYAIFITSITGLIIVNMFNKKSDKKNK